MYDLVCLAVDPPDAVAAVLTDAAAAGGATAIEADATLPGSINAGATIARLRFAGAAERDRAAARIEARTDDGIDVYRIGGDTRVAAGGTAVGPVYRVLLARVEPDAPEETVRSRICSSRSSPTPPRSPATTCTTRSTGRWSTGGSIRSARRRSCGRASGTVSAHRRHSAPPRRRPHRVPARPRRSRDSGRLTAVIPTAAGGVSVATRE